MKLLIRPRWKEGESWGGYLMRIADANSLPSVLTISKVTGIPYAYLILGHPKDILETLQFAHKKIPCVSMVRGVGNSRPVLPKWGRPKHTHICPECLRTDSVPYLRAIWEFPLEVSCRIHKLRLIAHCPKCKVSIQTRSGIYLQCRCGLNFKDFTSSQTKITSDQIRQILRVDASREAELTFQPPSAREMSAFVVLENLAQESEMFPKQKGTDLHTKKRFHTRYDTIQLSAMWFEDWPRCFVEKLGVAALRPSNRGVFHRRQHLLHPNEFPQLKVPIEELIRSRALQRKQSTRAEIARIDPIRMTLAQAQAYLGVSRDTCIAWAEAGSLGPIDVSRQQGFSLRYVAASDVQRLGGLLRTTISVQEASDMCGLSPRSIYALIKCDVLTGPRLLKHEMTTRLNEEDVKSFAASIFGIAKKQRFDPTMRSLSDVIYEIYDYVGKQHILALICFLKERSLPIYRIKAGSRLLENLFIPRSAVARLYRRVRNGYPVPS